MRRHTEEDEEEGEYEREEDGGEGKFAGSFSFSFFPVFRYKILLATHISPSLSGGEERVQRQENHPEQKEKEKEEKAKRPHLSRRRRIAGPEKTRTRAATL